MSDYGLANLCTPTGSSASAAVDEALLQLYRVYPAPTNMHSDNHPELMRRFVEAFTFPAWLRFQQARQGSE